MNILYQLAITAGDINIPDKSGDQVFGNILNLFYFIAGIVAVIIIIIAGFSITVSGSNPSALAKARNAMLYSAIGLIVILTAFGITQFVLGRI